MAKRPPKNEKILRGPISEEEFKRPHKPQPQGFEWLVEKLIRKAEEEGKFDNLTNEGRPIKIEEENPYIPEDLRLAFKVLENAGASPPWIEMEKDVNTELERANGEREQHRRWIVRRLNDIKAGPFQHFMQDLRRLAASHEAWLANHAKRLTELNQRIYSFNDVCPLEEHRKAPLQVEKIIEAYDKSCPTIPKV